MTWSKLTARFFSGNNNKESKNGKNKVHHHQQDQQQKEFTFLKEYPKVLELITSHANQLSDEALVKVLRQLEFWSKQPQDDDDTSSSGSEQILLERTKSLLFPLTSLPEDFKCPTIRFGKTEIQMPIITCGGMRLQYSWMPDSLGPLISPNTSTVLKSPSQDNLKACILRCLKHGLNHFETARMYGTSELQFATALGELIQSKTIRREDFILQTKIIPKATCADFEKVWNESWIHWQETIGYIDLFALHVVSSTKSCDWLLLNNGDDDSSEASCTIMQFVQELQQHGKIKYIGFSTHGTSHNVMRLINSQKFDYVNLHAHFFGDYHAEGTMQNTTDNSNMSHGNHAAVQRALELDMGVFQISPLDKGGKMYLPSTTVAKLLGPSNLSPISFVCLHAWETLGFHTTSIGISCPADLDDALYAAYLYSRRGGDGDDDFRASLQIAEHALTSRMHETLGTEWMTKGMLNLPDCEQPITQGVAMGHVLWLHNLCMAFGMYDFCRDRYANLESQPWNDKLSFEQNLLAFPDGNMGRGYIPTGIDYEIALKDHYDAQLVIQKLKEAHEWLCKKNVAANEEQRLERGWDRAYNLTCWEDYPGAAPTATGVLLQIITLNQFGCGGGPTKMNFYSYSKKVRESLAAMWLLVREEASSSSSPSSPSSDDVEPPQ